MTIQRKRGGLPITITTMKWAEDRRGNKTRVPDYENPITSRAWVMPGDGAKAEVVGQITINTIRVGVSMDLSGIELDSRVQFMDKEWDVVQPPKVHRGVKRHTRHWSFDLRERPN